MRHLNRAAGRSLLLTSLMLVIVAGGCRKASREIGFGMVSNGTYVNKKLGLGFKVPETWITSVGRKLNKQSKDAPSYKQNLVHLFEAVSMKDSARSLGKQINLAVFAERVKYNWKFKNERDYIAKARKEFRETGKADEYVKKGASVDFSSTKFIKLGKYKYYTFKIVLSDKEIKRAYGDIVEHYFMRVHQGYLVAFRVVYFNKKKSKEKILEVMRSIRFKNTGLES